MAERKLPHQRWGDSGMDAAHLPSCYLPTCQRSHSGIEGQMNWAITSVAQGENRPQISPAPKQVGQDKYKTDSFRILCQKVRNTLSLCLDVVHDMEVHAGTKFSGSTVTRTRRSKSPFSSTQVLPCSNSEPHSHHDCPFAHPGEKYVRRDPLCCYYRPVACKSFRKVRKQDGT
jgi:hypothetical protein